VGKQAKVQQSITPYVKFIQGLDRSIETLYLIGRAENEEPIKTICAELSAAFAPVAEKRVSKILLYGDERRHIKGFVAVLRSRQRDLYAPADPKL
jgi:hypothetical protein